MLERPPLSLYIHIPWCVRKCPYCDFNSHEAKSAIDEQTYIDALLHDLDDELRLIHKPPMLTSIFIGGGTPSLFSADSIQRILQGCNQRLPFSKDTEITMEANPGTFEQDQFSGFRQAGVNRISIGIQSFDAQQLKNLGRIHDAAEAHTAIDIAQRAGFDNINIDLMYALPQQEIEQALDDTAKACAHGVEHISHYQLTLEPNTYFFKHPPQQPDNDAMWQMQNACQQRLAEHGYTQYEVSAYAKDNKQSKHNLNYWQFGDYIGIGAGAHGKITDPDTGNIIRRWKKRQPAEYTQSALQNDAISGQNEITKQDRIFEFMMNALRLRAGVETKLFVARTGLRFEDLQLASSSIDDELLIVNSEVIKTTEKGYRFVDDILQQLLPSDN